MDEMQPGVDPTPAKLRIDATLATKLNLADFQNAIPVIRELRIINETEQKLEQVKLTLSSEPAFFKPKSWHIDTLVSGAHFPIYSLDLALDGGMLARLTEAEIATVTLTLHSAHNSDPLEIFTQSEFYLELLPRNQWGGLSHLPDLVAAFVQPNDPAIDRLLKQTAEILDQNGRNRAIDGYTGGSKRAWEITSAIWNAIVALKLDYALPPASFEQSGQKVRHPSHIEATGLATCFDLSLFFCAALEQAGLNPILIFTSGHTFAGVWLKPEEFSTTVIDDITAIRKRIKLNELLLFETTLVTQRPSVAFSYALERGVHQVSEDQSSAFLLAVDIQRARLQRIKPLSNAGSTDSISTKIDQTPSILSLPQIEDAPDLPEDTHDIKGDSDPINSKDRLLRWQRKLLDLSLRNKLLNFKGSKKSLKLDAPDPGALEDLLSSGQHLKLLPRPDLMDGVDPRNQAIYESREHENVRRIHALDAFKRREIFVSVTESELDSRLTEMFRGARTILQEGGANTLYLALGFLSWTRDNKETQSYRAPLILIPVTLQRKSVRSGFTLTLHDDEPRFNPTLIEMLRQDFHLNLGVVEGELPRDDAGLDVAAIWKTVGHSIKDIKGWEINEDVVLSMFSFAKYLMWKDLAERSEQLRHNSVVRHLLDTPRDAYPSNTSFPDIHQLDQQFEPRQVFCPLPADSSQLSAVLAASQGKDFVLIGPPGTGKSQTIANMITQSLAEGRRVLFVSEKIAALDVVYRRLREVGLGEFCLELHSNKARKIDVLSQLQSAWESNGKINSEQWQIEAENLKKLRDALNIYVKHLHHRHHNGLSVFDAIGIVSSNRDELTIPLAWPSTEEHSRIEMDQLRDAVNRLESNAQVIGHNKLTQHLLVLINQSNWSPSWQQKLISAAQEVLPAAQAVIDAAQTFITTTGIPYLELTPSTTEALSLLSEYLPTAAGHDWRFILRPDAKTLTQQLKEGANLVRQHIELNAQISPIWSNSVTLACEQGLTTLIERQTAYNKLSKPWLESTTQILNKGLNLLVQLEQHRYELSTQYNDSIEHLNITQLHQAWIQAKQTFWPKSWFEKRRVRNELLSAVIDKSAKLNIGNDLQQWITIRSLRHQVQQISPDKEASAIWMGLQTQENKIRTALRWQIALTSIHQGQDWKDLGFEEIEKGDYGQIPQIDLQNARYIRQLDKKLADFSFLEQCTENLWSGTTTQVEQLRAALDFFTDRRGILQQGSLESSHPLVEAGICNTTLFNDWHLLHKRTKVERELSNFENLRESTAGLWQGLSTSLDDLSQACQLQVNISTVLNRLAKTPDQISKFKDPLQGLLGNSNTLLESDGAVTSSGTLYRETLQKLKPKYEILAITGHFTETAKIQLQSFTLTELVEYCKSIIHSVHNLRNWCNWLQARDHALSLGLKPLIDSMEKGQISSGQTISVFKVNYVRWWLNAVVDHEPIIRDFVSAEHEQRIRDFRELDERFTTLTRDFLRARLCTELPQQDSVSRNSEWGVLRHEMNKKRAHMPLRELMSRIPGALTTLTPCLLMSPLSIAQYLDTCTNAFDLVIFDEASQIPVWDAIGAIARGRQVVMVGDPKQLPPTSFFDRAESGLDDEDIEADLESILDECLGANLPTQYLNWHYRSRHESLITFSNLTYYDSKLVTFPSSVTDDRAVSLKLVSSTYQKGTSRTNPSEAKALVTDIVDRLTTPYFRESGQTIGVVTFNSEQQKLIEDLFDAARRQDPRLEHYFSENNFEPLFIKNLESVQGDERDIIYFSITYGPDAAGQLAMNFGPLNRQGGERRLNVAITRARHELRVFSSFTADQMDLARTQAKGVQDLKHFLQFAEHGARALIKSTPGSLGDFDSPFEQSVASALSERGWQIRTQVGASSFRIDLGIIDPDAPGRYLAGIECDGATYHRSATARDRDKLREYVLRGLGWEILRVWSTDWWTNPIGTLEKLDSELNALLAKRREQQKESAPHEIGPPLNSQLSATNIFTDIGITDKLSAEEKSRFSMHATDYSAERKVEVFAHQLSTEPVYSIESSQESATALYIITNPGEVVANINPDIFFDTSYITVLSATIDHVIQHEGPILDNVLARRIARAHGWLRTGARIRDHVSKLAKTKHQITTEDIGTFYWPAHLDPSVTPPFRKPGNDDSIRPTDEICLPELITLARKTLNRGLIGDQALYAMARELDLQQLRATSRARLEKALKALL